LAVFRCAASAIKQSIETELIKIPMIDLPLGATEDRVCGTIDIEL
jgi:magnesium chelatase subunit I